MVKRKGADCPLLSPGGFWTEESPGGGRRGMAGEIHDEKARFFHGPVKKTYLTLMYLTAILPNICKGFVLEKNTGRACVKILPFLLNWAKKG